jgi:mannose-6-phosphate isomerase-like protein (cupin superfamily)
MTITKIVYNAVRRYLLTINEPRAKRLISGIPPDPPPRPLATKMYDVTKFLRVTGAIAGPAAGKVMETLEKHGSELCWRQSYVEEDFGSTFLDNYGFLELLGLRGHFHHSQLALGILILGPNIDYPAHYHSAEEVYIPLSGSAYWSKAGRDFVVHPRGAIVHHKSNVVHAIRTGDDPLITAYIWTGGDLTQKSTIVDQEI